MWYIVSKFIVLQFIKYAKCLCKESNVSILLFIYHECFVNRDETPIAHIIYQNKSSASHTCTTGNPVVSTFTSTNRTYSSCFITLVLTDTVAVLRAVISKCPWFTYYKKQYDNCVYIIPIIVGVSIKLPEQSLETLLLLTFILLLLLLFLLLFLSVTHEDVRSDSQKP